MCSAWLPGALGVTGPLPWAELGHITIVLQPQLLTHRQDEPPLGEHRRPREFQNQHGLGAMLLKSPVPPPAATLSGRPARNCPHSPCPGCLGTPACRVPWKTRAPSSPWPDPNHGGPYAHALLHAGDSWKDQTIVTLVGRVGHHSGRLAHSVRSLQAPTSQ